MEGDEGPKIGVAMARYLFVSLCLACAGFLLLAEAASARPRVSDVRVGVHPEKTRVVIEMTEAPSYRIFRLADPYRVVIDLPELDWPGVQLPRSMGVIAALRYGLFTPGTSRVVLDTTGPVAITDVLLLEPRDGRGHRMVLDLSATDVAAFQAELRSVVIESETPLVVARTAAPTPVPAARSDPRPMIVVDAGHGGVDPGAKSVSGIYEKELMLSYALELEKALLASGRYRVALTRRDDRFIPLRERVAIAQQTEADLFISLHANTNPSRKVKGASIYTLSENASDKEAEALAAKENKADIIAGVDLTRQTEVVSQILIDLAQRETMNLSKSAANLMVEEFKPRTKLLRNTHRYAGFAVLKSPSVPSLLIETGYMSNAKEERLLRSSAHRKTLVEAMVKGIDRYFAVQEAYRQ
jgi:N-acetylmuramoyl-L-alanine amidase